MRVWLLPVVLSLATVAPARANDGGVTRPRRPLSDVKLLVFTATWCQSCKRFEAGGALTQVSEKLPVLAIEFIDVDARKEDVERYGIEVTPSLVLVDGTGFPLGRPAIDLADPRSTAERVIKLVQKMTR